MPVAFVRDENRGVQKRPPGVVLVVLVVIVVIVIEVVVREKSQQQHTQIVRDGRKKRELAAKGLSSCVYY